MTPLARLHLHLVPALVLALVVLACKKPELDRREREPVAEAGTAVVTGATVSTERGGADAAATVTSADAAAAAAPESVRLRAFGAIVEDASDDRGAAVARVTPGSQAASVVRPGDVITAVDVVPIRSADDLGRYLDKARRGVVVLTVDRAGTSSYVVVTLD